MPAPFLLPQKNRLRDIPPGTALSDRLTAHSKRTPRRHPRGCRRCSWDDTAWGRCPDKLFGCFRIAKLLLTVSDHHSKRCLNSRHGRQNQIQQNKRIRIKRPGCRHDIDNHPHNKNSAEGKYNCPISGKFFNGIRRAPSERIFFLSAFGPHRNLAVRRRI